MALTPEAKSIFLNLLNEKTEASHDTGKDKEEKARRAANRKAYEARAGYRTPTSDLTEKILAAERIVWLPHNYVLFVRQSTCKNCGTTERVLDVPRLFLQQRKQRRDESNPYIYTPVKAIEFHTLPRRTVLSIVTVPFCLLCFEGPTCESSSFFHQADMQSLIDELGKLPPESRQTLLQGAASQFSLKSLSQLYTKEGEFGGAPSETDFGSGSASGGFAQPVTVEG